MAELLLQVLSLLVLGFIPAILLIGALAAIPSIWLVGCVLFRRTFQPVFAAKTGDTSL